MEGYLKVGSAVVWWILNGKLHRTVGPAIVFGGGAKKWYLKGKYVSEKESNKERKSWKDT